MLHELPITNVRLLACHEDWQQMTPTERGRHCQSCNREVVDFTEGTTAQLAAARAASADGRVCGRFRPAQVATAVALRGRQRWFLAAAVLILLQGLSACELQDQLPPESLDLEALDAAQAADTTAAAYWRNAGIVGMMAPERMPEFAGGQDSLLRYLERHIQYPQALWDDPKAQGKVFVSFNVLPSGHIDHVEVTKGVHPLLDAEAVRAVEQMPPWTPGEHNDKLSTVRYTLPITFINQAEPTKRGRK